MTVASQIARRDFGAKIVKALAARGVTFYGTTVIPSDGPMPYANGQRGYKVDDNGCGRVWTYTEVMEAAR